MTEEPIIIYPDDQGNPCPKEEATQVRILRTDPHGDRLEVYGIIDRRETTKN